MSATTDIHGQVLDKCESFARTYLDDEVERLNSDFATESPAETVTVTVSWSDLNRFDPDLAADYFTAPDVVRTHLAHALAETARIVTPELTAEDLREATIRFTDLPEHHTVEVGEFRPSDVVGEVRGLRGQVSQVTKPVALGDPIVFTCQRCETNNSIHQTPEQLQEPHECEGCERQGPFTVDTEATRYSDYQRARIETPPERRGREGSEHVDVTLRNDLVREMRPGERVTLTTAIDMEATDDDRPTFDVTGTVRNVTHEQDDLDAVAVEEYREEIEAIRDRDDTAEAVIDSIAPSIYGHEDVKQALALQLFGGVHRTLSDGSERRGTINVLCIGDPGTGKSILLSYIADLAPRSVYTSGSGTTAVGLTAAAVQDDFGGGGWTIEAGALVQAHKGVCCIDELDDMREEDTGGMLEAMSKQTVTKTAAGKQVKMPARTTVLAAANPEHGRFDEYEPVGEQVDLEAPLISRFDLIFTFEDEVDRERDKELSAQMLAAARDDQLEEQDPEIPKEVLRAYIAYARNNVDPTLSPDAGALIRQRYVDIRQANDEDGPVPTTPRLLDAMRRLAEASARMRLSETVTEADAERAANLAVSCLRDVGVDPETGAMDADIIETGKSKSQHDRIKTIESLLHDLESEHSGGVPREEVIDRCEAAGLERDKVEHEIEKKIDRGEFYIPEEDCIKSV